MHIVSSTALAVFLFTSVAQAQSLKATTLKTTASKRAELRKSRTVPTRKVPAATKSTSSSSSTKPAQTKSGTKNYPIDFSFGTDWQSAWKFLSIPFYANATSGLERVERKEETGGKFAAFLRVHQPKGSVVGMGQNYGQAEGGVHSYITGDAPASDRMVLTYYVRIPKDFALARGGVLPCLFGGRLHSGATDGSKIWCEIMWNQAGELEILGSFKKKNDKYANLITTSGILPRDGAWHKIDLEMVLNSGVGKFNGMVRLALDGQDVGRSDGVFFRSTTDQKLEGINFSNYYTSLDAYGAAPQDTFTDFAGIKLSN